jgi:hypothetical protein
MMKLVVVVIIMYTVLQMEPRALHILGKCFAIKRHPQPQISDLTKAVRELFVPFCHVRT